MGTAARPGEVVARRVREVRLDRRLTQRQLADRLRGLWGDASEHWPKPLARATVAKVENLERGVLVEDLLALALALNVSPSNLLLPADDAQYIALAPTVEDSASWVRQWIYGHIPLPREADRGEFMRHATPHEQREYRAGVHEVVIYLAELRRYVIDALDRRHPTSEARQQPLQSAEALRSAVARVAASVERLAQQLEAEAPQPPPPEGVG